MSGLDRQEKRIVMERAWEIKRENKDNIFALCLKMAWAEANKRHSYRSFIPTKKQIGVIYATFKKGMIAVTREEISKMYDIVNDYENSIYYERPSSDARLGMQAIGEAVSAIFENDYTFVEKALRRLAA